MTSVARIDAARLTVLLDIRHPHAYLAFHPVAELADELGLEINWLPLDVPPLIAPSTPGPDDDRGLRHRRYRAQAIKREIETYASARGLVIRDFYRNPDTAALKLGWLWLREQAPELLLSFLSETFRAYWSLALDPGSPVAVAGVIDWLGADASQFQVWATGDGPAMAASLAQELQARGLFGVPGYLLDGEVFSGRQHMPMLRWILTGRAGPGPI